MGIVVIGLIVVVGLMAIGRRQSTVAPPQGTDYQDVNTPLGPNRNLPSLGATTTFSPAKGGSSPLVAKSNSVRLGMIYTNVTPRPPVTYAPAPKSAFSGFGSTPTDADTSLRTQSVPPLVSTLIDQNTFVAQATGKDGAFKF